MKKEVRSHLSPESGGRAKSKGSLLNASAITRTLRKTQALLQTFFLVKNFHQVVYNLIYLLIGFKETYAAFKHP